MIRAITFDVGGTLLRPFPSVGQVYAQCALEIGYGLIAPEALDSNFARAWKARQNFRYQKSEWAGLVNESFQGLCSQPVTAELFETIYQRFAKKESWEIYPDVLPTLEKLHLAKIPLGIISNWDERLPVLLRDAGLSSFFSVILHSNQHFLPKPDPVMFLEGAKQFGLPPSKILHVGDDPAEDIEGASRAGFRSLWLRRGELSSSSTIRSLGDIDLGLLKPQMDADERG